MYQGTRQYCTREAAKRYTASVRVHELQDYSTSADYSLHMIESNTQYKR